MIQNSQFLVLENGPFDAKNWWFLADPEIVTQKVIDPQIQSVKSFGPNCGANKTSHNFQQNGSDFVPKDKSERF